MVQSQFWKTLVVDGAPSQRYEILQEIASGGMATVYLACRRGPLGFERTVAIKRASAPTTSISSLQDATQQAQLAREAQLAARVHHPNVVSVIDVELVDGEPLLVMEYIEGTSLAQLMSAGALSSSMIARILLDVCEGLEAIHAARDEEGRKLGMVHRDISPQNVLVGLDGVARVADFGIAVARSSPRTTSHNSRRGKPGYMAPEYIADGTAYAAGDIFALGVILWEALSGRRLFARASSLEELRLHHQRHVPPPSEFVDSVPSRWDDLALRALGKHTRSRFGTAAEFGHAIEDAADGRIASRQELARLVEEVAHESIWLRRAIIRERQRASQIDQSEVPSATRVRVPSAHELPTRPELLLGTPRLPLTLSEEPTGTSDSNEWSIARARKPYTPSRRACAIVGVLVGVVLSAVATSYVLRGVDPIEHPHAER